MFKRFFNKKVLKIQADTLYSIAKDIFKEQETEEIDIPYFLKAYKFTTDVIKSGQIEKKLEMLLNKGNKNA